MDTVGGKYFANENRGACGTLSRSRLQLFVAPPLDPPDPRFQCCLDLCCALAKYIPLLTPSFLLGVTFVQHSLSSPDWAEKLDMGNLGPTKIDIEHLGPTNGHRTYGTKKWT